MIRVASGRAASRLGALAAVALASGCLPPTAGMSPAPAPSAPASPSPAASASPAVAPVEPDGLPPGSIGGKALRLEGERFVPAGLAQLLVDGEAVQADAAGRWTKAGLAPGAHVVAIAEPGMAGVEVVATLGATAGLPFVNVPLVPDVPPPAGEALFAGVVVDRRGASLGAGRVRAAAPVSADAGAAARDLVLDADGAFVWRLRGVPTGVGGGGPANLEAFGRTRGRVVVEPAGLVQVDVYSQAYGPLVLVAARTDVPDRPAWRREGDDVVVLPARPSHRLDETALAPGGPGCALLAPSATGEAGVRFRLPPGCAFDPARAELHTLGLGGPLGSPQP